MLKNVILFFLLIISLYPAHCFAISPDREELLNLLKERNDLFERYSKSLTAHSGFFGQRTKNDLRESQERLKEIISQDNRIIGSLNRILDYRNFEKISQGYDASRDDEHLRNLSQVNDTLLKQVMKFEKEIKELKKTGTENSILGWLGWILFLGLIFWLGYRRRKQNKLS